MNLIQVIKESALPIKLVKGLPQQYETIIQSIGDAKIVMLGSQTHGTKEFYQHRSEITKLLITKKNFNVMAIESDWADTYNINRFLHDNGQIKTVQEALLPFHKYPYWLWRNQEFVDFLTWLKNYNDNLKIIEKNKNKRIKIGIYGLDIYGLHSSIELINKILKSVDSKAASQIRKRFSLIDHYVTDTEYVESAKKIDKKLIVEIHKAINDIRKEQIKLHKKKGFLFNDEIFFDLEENTKLIKDSEEFYRTIIKEPAHIIWNKREIHMANVLKDLINHFKKTMDEVKIIIWQHNAHVGDASATEWKYQGEVNFGQLIRQEYGLENVYSIGFTTFQGQITASHFWGLPPENMELLPAQPGSIEEIFHQIQKSFMLITRSNDNKIKIKEELYNMLKEKRKQRSVGIVYRPETELNSHYFIAKISKQFDAVIHLDHTKGLNLIDNYPVLTLPNNEIFDV